jgi:DNA helicase-4
LEAIYAYWRKPIGVRRYLRRKEIKAFCKSVRDSLSDVIDSLTKILSHPYTERIEEAISCRRVCQIVESALNPEGDFYKDRNEKFVREEILRLGNLLLGLNEEQQRAAIIFEDRNLLVAVAGSGKTRTLIGKARYAIEQGLYERGEIIALAFNKDATLDLTKRFKREWPLVSANRLPKAHTFHGLGNFVLRKTAGAEGKRSPSFENATKKHIVSEIIERLKEQDNAFLEAWTLFVALCAEPVPTEDAANGSNHDPSKKP